MSENGSACSVATAENEVTVKLEGSTQSIADYLSQLLKDKKQLGAFHGVFLHLERLLDEEIGRVRGNLFQINGEKHEPLVLPESRGPPVSLQEKVYVPIKEYPEFNFVGRILGPRGMTTKQLEQETGCKIMVRGKGSMRDRKKEDQNRGKPNWEHLNDELHVLITVEDSEERAQLKLKRAVDEVKKLLVVCEGEDELKKRQLMELAIINGTYRDSQTKAAAANLDASRFLQSQSAAFQQSLVREQQQQNLRNALGATSSSLGGAPLILSPRLQPVPTSAPVPTVPTAVPPLVAPGDTQNLLYAQYAAAAAAAAASGGLDYANYAAAVGLINPLGINEYNAAQNNAQPNDPAGGKSRRGVGSSTSGRAHPYSRS